MAGDSSRTDQERRLTPTACLTEVKTASGSFPSGLINRTTSLGAAPATLQFGGLRLQVGEDLFDTACIEDPGGDREDPRQPNGRDGAGTADPVALRAFGEFFGL
jgi:hypothetical protein